MYRKDPPLEFFKQSETSASLGRVDDVIRTECDQSQTSARPSPTIYQSDCRKITCTIDDVIGVKGQVDDEGSGKRNRGSRTRRQGPGRGPGRAGIARALARAVGEEKLRFGSVTSNPGRGG